MRSLLILAAVLMAGGLASGCGSSTPTTPGTTTPGVVTVSIVGTKGNGSYVPNPVPTNRNQVLFKNNDPSTTHHIVMDDGSADFGDLSPGASGPPRTVVSGNF